MYAINYLKHRKNALHKCAGGQEVWHSYTLKKRKMKHEDDGENPFFWKYRERKALGVVPFSPGMKNHIWEHMLKTTYPLSTYIKHMYNTAKASSEKCLSQ